MADLKSWNLWHGCRKCSEGCANCYMYFLDGVRNVPERSAEIVRTQAMGLPLAKNRKGVYKIPSGYCLRVNMTSDTFLEEADPWRGEMWRIIRRRPDVRFFLLTKRAHRIAACLPSDWGDGYENVQLNISCENQDAFDERWPHLAAVPGRHKGLNLAPMIGPIDITPALASGKLEQVCLGGEGFGGRRPCRYEWVKQVSDDCRRFRVNFAFNATGEVFEKDGKTYHIDGQDLQGRQAYRSGLSCFFGEPEVKLYDPYDGHLLGPHEQMTRVYHAGRCVTCSNFEICIGCVDCGSCKNVKLVSREEILRLRAKEEKKRSHED